MRKKKSNGIIKIARAGEQTYEAVYEEDKSIGSYFEDAEITLASGEELYVEAEEAGIEDVLEADDLVQIVGKKEGGIR